MSQCVVLKTNLKGAMGDVVATGGDVVLNNCEVSAGFMLNFILNALWHNISV
jgi:hypothetical protein